MMTAMVKTFFNTVRERCRGDRLSQPFTGLVFRTWELLFSQAVKLQDTFPGGSGRSDVVLALLIHLNALLSVCIQFMSGHMEGLRSVASNTETVMQPLKLGLGSPSTTGCMDSGGHSVKFNVLHRHPTSLQAAFLHLQLHAIGLPGVRLPSNFHLPADCGFSLIVVGQPNYNSVAATLRRGYEHHFTKVEGIGSDRRLWLRVAPVVGPSFLWLIFYLPANDEDLWHHEVEGINQDMANLQAESPRVLTLWMGDANLQPSAVGKGPDIRISRDKAWMSLVSKWALALLNPPGFGDSPVEVFLPSRHKSVLIRPSDTHHCNGGPGVSRTLDLSYGSPDLLASTLVHNSLHCKLWGCCWDDCLEFTASDHFLLETSVGVEVSGGVSAVVSLPRHWNEQALWEHGL